VRVEYVPVALERMDDWINRLGRMLPSPVRSGLPGGDFTWRFPTEDLAVLVFTKAVRVGSSLGGAWQLAELGYTTEAGALCRVMEDFASEIQFMAEAHIEGRETRAQSEFREQYFRAPPRTVEEYLNQERQHYVTRREIAKAARRLAEKAEQDGGLLERMSGFIAYALNRYVHGSYESAMELYHGGKRRFMVRGVDGRPRDASRSFVAAKATEALHAVELVAMLFGAKEIATEIRTFLAEADPNLQVPT